MEMYRRPKRRPAHSGAVTVPSELPAHRIPWSSSAPSASARPSSRYARKVATPDCWYRGTHEEVPLAFHASSQQPGAIPLKTYAETMRATGSRKWVIPEEKRSEPPSWTGNTVGCHSCSRKLPHDELARRKFFIAVPPAFRMCRKCTVQSVDASTIARRATLITSSPVNPASHTEPLEWRYALKAASSASARGRATRS